ncbi:hypothetical protein Tco_1059148 [Tanacetum coccineum]
MTKDKSISTRQDAWIIDKIKKSKAYNMYFKCSTGLNPPRKGRDESEGEPQNRPTGRKTRTPRAVVIQEPLSVPVKKIQESYGKLKGAGLRSEVLDELTGKSVLSDEGVNTYSEVPDETKDKNDKPDEIPWYSIEEDESNIDAQDESDDEEEEDNDKSIVIENNDDERMDTDDEHMVMGKAKKVEEQKANEEHEADKEQKEDEQVGDEQINSLLDIQIQQDVPHIQQEPFYAIKVSVIPESTQQPPSTPPAPPLLATKIPSSQVPNSKAVNSIVQRFTELEQVVKELKHIDHSATILTSIISQVPPVVEDYLRSSLPDAFQKVLRSHTKELIKELSEKRNYKDVIEESVQANVINKVKNFLPKYLPQDVKEALEKTSSSIAQSFFHGQSAIQAAESLSEYELKKILYAKMLKSQSNLTHNTHQELFDALTWLMLLDDANMKGEKPDIVLKKRDQGDDQDEGPSAGSNHGKTKKRRINESESSKKTSATKESSKGKSLSKTSKSGKSMTAKEPTEDPIF